MKKPTLQLQLLLQLLLFVLLACSVTAQNSGLGNVFAGDEYDCGTWQKDCTYYTSWETIDTIQYNEHGDTVWIYSEYTQDRTSDTYLAFCPCGCGYDDVWWQDRVCGLGIIQRRWKITTYKYIPKPESAFERRVRELKK